ncbi:uncharacterized protein LOC127577484 [Pristis pectinata]|uniref:uncharacterized protein LOC127577484 n=1 Tax=Pristis pectinata TaxID=685728 RepID=UPI00223D7A3F|nr:uncharacterized protein LOC127577484 [Pristis pectinata]
MCSGSGAWWRESSALGLGFSGDDVHGAHRSVTMTSHREHVRRPWIAELLLEQGAACSWCKSAPVQVTELVPLENWIKEAGYESAVVVYISDLKYRIRAVLTEEAGNNLQQEEENYTLNQLKNKGIILKKFTIQVRLELELKDCEFYLVVQDLKILPGDMGFSDARPCNKDVAVQKKLRELWQSYLNNMITQEKTFTDLCLSNMINAAAEDEISVLKHAAEICLDPNVGSKVSASTTPFLLPSANQTTGWKAMRRQNKNKRNIFTVSEAMLMISSHQEEALNNIKEWKDDFVCAEDPESEHNGYTDTSMCIAEEQEAPSSQNPWNAVSPVCLGGIPSSGETCISCTCTSESCKKHDGKCHALCSTFVDAPACGGPAVEFQLPDSNTQDDPDKSVELYTEESEHSEVQFRSAKGLLLSPATSADKGMDSMYVAELKEGNREKSMNSSMTAYNHLFKSLSPLSSTTINSSGLNCVGSFKNVAPVSAVKNGGQCRPSVAMYNHAAVAGNSVLEMEEKQVNDSRDEECYEIPRAAKRKRQHMNAEDQLDGNGVDQGTSWMQTRAEVEDENSRNLSSNGTFIETDHCEEIANDVCQVNINTEHKKEGGMNKMLKDIDLNNLPGNKKAILSSKYNKLEFVSERPSQVRNFEGQASVVTPIGQHTEDDWMHVLHQHNANQNKDEPQRHPDGSRFLYSYPAPTAELIAQVNSVRVSSELLKWAVSYLSGPSLTRD